MFEYKQMYIGGIAPNKCIEAPLIDITLASSELFVNVKLLKAVLNLIFLTSLGQLGSCTRDSISCPLI